MERGERKTGMPPAALRDDVPLGPLTTLGLGGVARFLVEAADPATVGDALAWAAARGTRATVLGGGSNLVVADSGFDGLVVRLANRGHRVERGEGSVRVTAAAGEPWDDLVAWSVAEGLAGLECLSGIPGTVGATPIQNVGAYGQEVADSIASVQVLDRGSLEVRAMTPQQCAFAYRDSIFRRRPQDWVVLAVTFALRPGGAPTLRYQELAAAFGSPRAEPALADVRAAVLQLRRAKSMVLDDDDPNRRSVGSFFLNPVLSSAEADAVVDRALAVGAARGPDEVPRFEAGAGRAKLSAAWLVERAGFTRGLRRGAVGISTRHCLALVHHGGGSTAELLALARDIRDGVHSRFGVELRPEPTFLGFSKDPL